MIGPSTAESPMTGPKTAKARPCSAGGKTSRMMPRPCGMRSAAAKPWARRQPISMAGLTDRAAASEAAAKLADPVTNRRLRPYRSPSLAPVSRPMAKARA